MFNLSGTENNNQVRTPPLYNRFAGTFTPRTPSAGTLRRAATAGTLLLGAMLSTTMTAHAQGHSSHGRGGELSSLLHAYFPVARHAAGNAAVNRRQASDLVRAASGGSVDIISVRTQGDTHYVKVLTHDRPPKMQTYKVDAKTGRVWR